jgi:hypothetical protein
LLVNLLLNQSVTYCRLFHFKEAIRCCDDALRLTTKSANVFYRRSQVPILLTNKAIVYNLSSPIPRLLEALKDIETAIAMQPGEDKYQRHKQVLEETMKTRVQEEVKRVSWLMKCAMGRAEHATREHGEAAARSMVSLKTEETTELKTFKKYTRPRTPCLG